MAIPEVTTFGVDLPIDAVDTQIYGQFQGLCIWKEQNRHFKIAIGSQKWFNKHPVDGNLMSRNAMYTWRLLTLLYEGLNHWVTPNLLQMVDLLFVWLCHTNSIDLVLLMLRANKLGHAVSLLYSVLQPCRGSDDILIQQLLEECQRRGLPAYAREHMDDDEQFSKEVRRQFRTIQRPFALQPPAEIRNFFGAQSLPRSWAEFITLSPQCPVSHTSYTGETLPHIQEFWTNDTSDIQFDMNYMRSLIQYYHPPSGGKEGPWGPPAKWPVNVPLVAVSAYLFHPQFRSERPFIFLDAALAKRVFAAVEYLMKGQFGIERDADHVHAETPILWIVQTLNMTAWDIEDYLKAIPKKQKDEHLLKLSKDKTTQWYLASEIFHWIHLATHFVLKKLKESPNPWHDRLICPMMRPFGTDNRIIPQSISGYPAAIKLKWIDHTEHFQRQMLDFYGYKSWGPLIDAIPGGLGHHLEVLLCLSIREIQFLFLRTPTVGAIHLPNEEQADKCTAFFFAGLRQMVQHLRRRGDMSSFVEDYGM